MLYKTRKFYLTNTVTGKREEFIPANPPKVLFYSCGPTVYGPLHIGNARALLIGDWLFRWLKHIGYDVMFVRNYTDVDDKIIDRAKEEKISALEVAEKYIDYCETDMQQLGLEKPVKTVRVTESMEDILKLIQKILDRGHAYVVDGEVLFSVHSFLEYGKLSGKKTDELQVGARVEVNTKKQNPLDFSLWKPHKPGEPFWESSWGPGRPGWHIECSAMVGRWLGETIDLHHGGQDLIFPHHENEIAQSESATGKLFCRHWVHHAFLTSAQEKMSKSLGNILTIRDFSETYGAEVLKFLFLSFHYRSAVPYTTATLSQVLNELERVYKIKLWAEGVVQGRVLEHSSDLLWEPFLGKAKQLFEKMQDELFLDFNTPGALGHFFGYIRELNRGLSRELHCAESAVASKVAQEFLTLLNEQIYPLLNIFKEDPNTFLNKINLIRLHEQKRLESVTLDEAQIQKLIEARAKAREQKDFKRADSIRNQLEAHGVVLIDNPSGTTWKYK